MLGLEPSRRGEWRLGSGHGRLGFGRRHARAYRGRVRVAGILDGVGQEEGAWHARAKLQAA